MKKQILLLIVLAYLGLFSACKKKEADPAPIVETIPEYQKAINAKFISLGWSTDGHVKFNNSNPVKTAGGNSWVQYYAFGDRKTAIYYSEKGAFGMDTEEMKAYDAAGQDKFAFVSSDPEACGGDCGYNEIIKVDDNSQGIIIRGKLVYGEIYKKYKAIGRWTSPLGHPTNSESTNSKGAKYNNFANGAIIYTSHHGAQAVWGKVYILWGKAGYDGGWLGNPWTSNDPNTTNQVVIFDKGSIGIGNGCDSYNNKGYYVDVNGSTAYGKVCY